MKQTPSQAQDRLPRICFLHVPKCAGTSIYNALKKHYPRNRIRQLRPGPAREAAETLNQGLDFRRSILAYHLAEPDVDLVHGHYQVTQEIIDAHPEYDFVTVLREPVRRYVSNFYYNEQRPEWDHLLTGRSIEAFIDTDEAWPLGYNYLRFFGSDAPDAPGEVAATINVLSRFKLIGVVERMADFVDRFADLYGIRLELGEDNKGPDLDKEPSAETLSKIAHICTPNRLVYKYAEEVAA